jgi:predicted HAD superfamily hydrolase
MERRWIRPVPETAAEISKWRSGGGSVVFLSDMYLPSNVIKGMLQEHDIWRSEDRLFVSCEHAAEKRDGRLFACMKDVLHPSSVYDRHVGNHEVSDIDGAQKAGLKTLYVPDANPSRYEAILGEAVNTCGVGAAQLAGASRYARLTTAAETVHERMLRNVAAGVISPLLVGFLSWVLTQAEKRSLKRLYFTSRDGQLLYGVARKLAPLLGIHSIDLRYVYFSRVSIASARCPDNMLSRVWDTKAPVSGTELLARLGLSPEHVAPYLSPEVSQSAIERPLAGKDVRTALRSAVEAYAKEHNGNHAQDERRLLHAYLVQEGFMDGTPAAFVDVGWHGTAHAIINEVLCDHGVETGIEGFYFGLNKNQQGYASQRHAYFFDRYRQLGLNRELVPNITTLMEMFCTADHGTVLSYKEVDGRVEPYLESSWEQRMSDWGLATVQQTVFSFLDALHDQPDWVQSAGIDTSVINELLHAFWQNPTENEARAWGSFPRELGQADEPYVQPLASPYDWSDVFYFGRYGSHAPWLLKTHKLSWTAGRLAASSDGIKKSTRWAMRIHNSMRRWARKIRQSIKYILGK